jgi:hypothetical protein
MVYRDGLFHETRIMAVDELDDGVGIKVTSTAARAEWFEPDSDQADPDGWVRGLTDVVAETELGFVDPAKRAAKLVILRRWRDEGALVEGRVELKDQLVGFVNEATGEVVAVKMSAEEQDSV